MADAGSLIKKGFILLSFMGLVILAGCSGGTAALKNDTALAKLEKVDVTDSDTSTTVVLVLDKPVTFTSVRLPDPPKMVVELAGVDLGENRESVKVDKGPISYITPSTVPEAHRIARLEIGLTRAANAVSTQDGATIRILFEKTKPEAAPQAKAESKPEAAPPAKAEPKPAEAPPAPAEKITAADTANEKPAGEKAVAAKKQVVIVETVPPVKAPAQKPAATVAAVPSAHNAGKAEANLPAANTVSNIGFIRNGDGYAVSIECDGKVAKPEVSRLGADRLIVDLPGMASRKDKDTIEVGGKLLKRVRMAGHKEVPRKVRVVLDLAGAFDYDVKADGKTLVVSVSPAGEKAAAKAPAPAKAEATSKPVPAAKAEVASIPVPAAKVETAKAEAPVKTAAPAPKPSAKPVSNPAPKNAKAAAPVNLYISTLGGKTVLSSSPIDQAEPGMTKSDLNAKGFVETPTKVYTGGRISFDIQDADLDKVMKLLADVAGLNLIMDPAEVKGKVTLKLDNVPWDQALDILLKIYNLDKVIDGNVLRIASKAKLDDETRRDLLAVAEQKKLEQQAEDLYTKTFKINYTPAVDLEPKIKKILSSRGDATANVRTNELIVTDIKSNIEKAAQLITILDKEVRQIMIEARIVEVDVGYSRSLGVSWSFTRNTGHNPLIGAGGGANSAGTAPNIVDGQLKNFQINIPSELIPAPGGFLGNLAFGQLLHGVNLDLTLQALEVVNKLETLSAPKLMTLENQAATIAQGTTIYVQTTSAAGTKPEPLNANLSLTVTPRVTGDNLIIMEVTATNNKPGDVPPGATAAIQTESVTTNVMVRDGDTVVLGGIFTKINRKTESRVPILGRIPIIGWLFKNKTFEEPQNELMIFITPKLIKQVSAQV